MSAPTKEQVEAAKAWTRGDRGEWGTGKQEPILEAFDPFSDPAPNAARILLAALEAAEADIARLDWLQHQLANMDSKARGTWLRIGDKGRVQVHRYPLHAMSVWDDSECVMDSIPDGTNDLREAIDAAIKSEKE